MNKKFSHHKNRIENAPLIRALLDCVVRYKFIYLCMYVKKGGSAYTDCLLINIFASKTLQ